MFSFFSKKPKKEAAKPYFPVSTDIHSHILPGIDDGSPDVETSIMLIKGLMEMGPKQVVITDGKRGAYTIFGNFLYHVIPNSTNSVETTGAGDAFASTFLACQIKKKDMETSLKLASKNAQSVISQKGAKKGLLDWKHLILSLKKNPVKLVKERI